MCSHSHRAAPLPALVCAVHSRDPEVWGHGRGLQPSETQARDPVCVSRVSPALHGTDPGGDRAWRDRMSQVGGRWQCLGWSLLPPFPYPTWYGGCRHLGRRRCLVTIHRERERGRIHRDQPPHPREQGRGEPRDYSLSEWLEQKEREADPAWHRPTRPVALGEPLPLSASQFPLVHNTQRWAWIIVKHFDRKPQSEIHFTSITV